MATQVVKVKRETLEACMTCLLCKKLLKEATTISLCLHTCEFICFFYILRLIALVFVTILIWVCACIPCIRWSGLFNFCVIVQFLIYVLLEFLFWFAYYRSCSYYFNSLRCGDSCILQSQDSYVFFPTMRCNVMDLRAFILFYFKGSCWCVGFQVYGFAYNGF